NDVDSVRHRRFDRVGAGQAPTLREAFPNLGPGFKIEVRSAPIANHWIVGTVPFPQRIAIDVSKPLLTDRVQLLPELRVLRMVFECDAVQKRRFNRTSITRNRVNLVSNMDVRFADAKQGG